MPGFIEEMSEYDEAIKNAEPSSGPPLFSDGSHQAIITLSRVEEGQFGWQWVLSFRGTDVNTGKPASIRKWTNLPPEEGRESYFVADLQLLGYDFHERGLTQLEQACIDEEFIGLVCDIGVKTKAGANRDYTNVYLNRVHGKGDVSQFVPAGEVGDSDFAGSDDDIPF